MKFFFIFLLSITTLSVKAVTSTFYFDSEVYDGTEYNWQPTGSDRIESGEYFLNGSSGDISLGTDTSFFGFNAGAPGGYTADKIGYLAYSTQGTGIRIQHRSGSGIGIRTSRSSSGLDILVAQYLTSFDLGGHFSLNNSSLDNFYTHGTSSYFGDGSGASLAVKTSNNEWFALTPTTGSVGSQISLSDKIWREIDVSSFNINAYDSTQDLVSLENTTIESLGIYMAVFNDGKSAEQLTPWVQTTNDIYWQERNFGVKGFEVSGLEAIPEPSTYALIFGISSLAFTIIIRRKMK